MEFATGLILGAIFGVAADRLWKKYEQRPRFEIDCSHFFSIDGDGLEFKVHNVGFAEIPPYKLSLFHPKRGTLSFFTSDSSGQPLLPKQAHKHACTLIRHRKRISQWGDEGEADEMLTQWFLHEFDYEKQENLIVSEPKYEGFQLRIVMENSDRVLFESESIGNAIAKEVVSAGKNRKAGGIGGYEHNMQLRYHRPTPIKDLLRRVKPFPKPNEVQLRAEHKATTTNEKNVQS